MDRNGGKLAGSIAVVTGGYRGIGKETSEGLMREGAHVVMAGRDLEKCEEVRRELEQRTGSSCSCARLDLDDRESVESFAKDIPKYAKRAGRSRRVSILVNCAGVMGVSSGNRGWHEAFRERSAQEADACRNAWDASRDGHVGPNHLGHFLLTWQLLRDEIIGPGSRIINVASRAHFQAPKLRFGSDGQLLDNPPHWYASYGRSKLMNILHVVELRRRFPDVTSTSISPGRVATGIFDNMPWPLGPVVKAVAGFAFQTPKQGAAGVLRAACDPEWVTNDAAPLYVHLGEPARPSAAAADEALAKQLWLSSAKYCGVADQGLD